MPAAEEATAEEAKPAEDANAEELVDEGAMRWVKTVGTGAPMESCAIEEEVEFRSALAGGRFQTLSRSHHERLERAYGQKPAPELSALKSCAFEEPRALTSSTSAAEEPTAEG